MDYHRVFCRIYCLVADLHRPSKRTQLQFVVAVKSFSVIPRIAVKKRE